MDIKNLAVEETSFLHLRDASDELLYEGEGDNRKEVGITLYGPGSKTFAKASQKRQNRLMDRMKKKGKTDTTPEESVKDNADFLAEVTHSFQCIESGELRGDALHRAVYADVSVGFIAEQAMKHIGEWGNFSKASSTI